MQPMRAAVTFALGAAQLIAIAACTLRPYAVECVGPGADLEPAECGDVADHVATRVGLQNEGFGKLMVVSVEVVDCRAEGVPEQEEPSVDRCWRVVLDYESGSMSSWQHATARPGTSVFTSDRKS
jgi:hypothetical protein